MQLWRILAGQCGFEEDSSRLTDHCNSISALQQILSGQGRGSDVGASVTAASYMLARALTFPPCTPPNALKSLERAKGFEPSTPTLARSCSTPELHPHPSAGRPSAAGTSRHLCQMRPVFATIPPRRRLAAQPAPCREQGRGP